MKLFSRNSGIENINDEKRSTSPSPNKVINNSSVFERNIKWQEELVNSKINNFIINFIIEIKI